MVAVARQASTPSDQLDVSPGRVADSGQECHPARADAQVTGERGETVLFNQACRFEHVRLADAIGKGDAVAMAIESLPPHPLARHRPERAGARVVETFG